MEIFLSTLLLISGIIWTIFSSALLSIAKSDFSADDTESESKIITHKLHNGELASALLVTEFILFTSATIILSMVLYDQGLLWYQLSLVYVLYAVLLFINRFFFNSLGIRIARTLANKYPAALRLMYNLNRPLAWVVLRLETSVGGRSTEEASREDINQIVETAHEEGSIETDEYRILKNIMEFSDVLVTDVMTPRTVVFSCRADVTVGEVINLPELRMYSRFPIREGEAMDDGIAGYVMSRDVLHAALSGKTDMKLSELHREVYYIPESAGLDKALDRFLHRHQHLLIVVDEYGGVEGLITMEDALETILGVEILDEADKVADLRLLAKQWRDKRVASFINKVG